MMNKITLKNTLTLVVFTICMGLFTIVSSPKTVMAQSTATTMDKDTEKVYQLVKAECAKVAKGEKTSVITLNISNFFDKNTYTFAELGAADEAEAKEVIHNRIKVVVESVLDRMKIDCPYELYWFDRTADTTINFTYVKNSTSIFFEDADCVSITMNVAKDYQASGVSIKLSSKAVARANASIRNAKAIVAKYAACSDEEKIRGYAREIKNMTTYKEEAITAAYLSKYGYGDPYQLTSVFDNDASTGTVCEGYAKAFQYLCDLSSFTKSESYIVTGTLTSNNTTGSHMWNVVRMDGQEYIVDVTNTSAEDCDLILTGAVNVDNKYLTLNQSKQKLYYTYDEDTVTLYDADLLDITHKHIADEAVKENVVAATCTTPESYDIVTYCKYCHEELSRESYTGESGEHDFTTTTVARTCTTEGYKLHVCKKCGYTYKNSIIPAFGDHTWDCGTKNANGTVTYKCRRCSATKVVGTPKVVVVNRVVKITLSSATSVKAGKTITVKAKVTTRTGKAIGVKWTVNNKKYAKVSAKGVVTGLKAGKGRKVLVTATAVDGSGVKASKVITIK